MIHSFNQTIEYIESVLDEQIDEEKIAYLSGYSYPMFSRIFSILAGYSLSEYIRLRKLTKAALDLRESGEKVIDIAFKYGYESSDAFTLAFKKFHDFTPSEVRKGAVFKVFSSIRLSLTIQGGKNMDIKITLKDAFKVVGIKAEAIDNSECPATWDTLFEKVSLDNLEHLGNGQSFGVCYDTDNMPVTTEVDLINYMAAYDLADEAAAKRLGLDILDIPQAEYAVVKLNGAIPKSIHEGWKYLIESFFPEQGYKHAGTPDFEVYSSGDMYVPEYEMELWVPIEKM